MDLSQLRAFVEVARSGNLTRASLELSLSQPALSSRIRLLEDEIGVLLFERTARGMTLTASGDVLFAEAERTLKAANGFVSRARAMTASLSGRVRLGTISEPVALRVGEFLSMMVIECPNVTVSLTQAVAGTIVEQLLARQLDAAYVIGRVDDPRISCLPLMDVRLCVAAPKAWASRLIDADWSTLGAMPWVGAPANCSYNGIMRKLFAEHGIAPRIVAEADQDTMLRSLVARGGGLSVLREDQARAGVAAGDLYLCPGTGLHSELCFVQRMDDTQTLLGMTLRRKVAQVWAVSEEVAAPV
jgi:DNA-binding transcriptional LysR family regulator